MFIGRWYGHRYHNPPYMEFFWDEQILGGVVKFFLGMEFHEYTQTGSISGNIRNFIHSVGWLFGFTGLIALVADRLKQLDYKVLLLGPLGYALLASLSYINSDYLDERGGLFIVLTIFSLAPIVAFLLLKKDRFALLFSENIYPLFLHLAGVFMFALAVITWKDRFFTSAQFFEFAIQLGLPFLLYHVIFKTISIRALVLTIKILCAITFASHAFYALGIYNAPGYWPSMVMNILGVSQSVAEQILFYAGFLDIIASILIFVPGFAAYALYYMVFWGFATAVSRLWGNFHMNMILSSIDQWWYHAVFRLPHGILPLICILMYRSGIDLFSKAKISIDTQ